MGSNIRAALQNFWRYAVFFGSFAVLQPLSDILRTFFDTWNTIVAGIRFDSNRYVRKDVTARWRVVIKEPEEEFLPFF